MFGRTSLLKATALSLSLGLTATAAQAASLVDAAKQTDELSRFSEAIAAAGLDQQLSGEGPFTIFAPNNQAFEQLPKGALDELMKQENQAQLTKLLEHHIVEGEKLAAKDVLGKQSKVDTASGDTLTVDGTSEVVLLVPTGLTITQVGDQVIVEREGMAIPAGAVEVRDQQVRESGGEQQSGQQGQQTQATQTSTAEPSDMPMSEHQQQALKSQPGQEQQQTAAEGGTDMPTTEHQRQVLEGGDQSQEQPTASQTATAERSDMPMSEHQQEVLKSGPDQEQQQTAAGGSTDMPATEHQREVLAEDELPGEQEQSYEQARVQGTPDILREAVVVEPDIQADNGVIHVIDAVLVPQSVLKTLEGTKGQG